MSNDNHKIRIIGGLFRGKQLRVLSAEGLRPTTDRNRETVFSLLGGKTENAAVLDLFAGSGSLGLEALSRGASSLLLVEKNPEAAAYLKEAVATLPKQAGKAEVLCTDALKFLTEAKSKGYGPFDLVFLDPPFSGDLLEKAAELLIENDMLAEDGIVYAEMGKGNKKPLFGLELIREGSAGVAHFGLYSKSFLF